MKRLNINPILLAAVAASFFPFQAASQPTGAQNIAIVRSLSEEGGLRHIRFGQNEVRDALLMEALGANDVVQTSFTARAAIQFTDDRSVIRMNPETQMQIRTEGERGAMTKIIDIESGEFWAEVNRREGSEFRIQTPTAVAAVRGTRFIVRVDPDGRTTVITLDGLLDFFTDVGTVQIPAGSSGSAAASNQSPVVDTTPASEILRYQGLIDGEGFGTGDSDGIVWETIEIPMVGPDGRIWILAIEVPQGSALEAERED